MYRPAVFERVESGNYFARRTVIEHYTVQVFPLNDHSYKNTSRKYMDYNLP